MVGVVGVGLGHSADSKQYELDTKDDTPIKMIYLGNKYPTQRIEYVKSFPTLMRISVLCT